MKPIEKLLVEKISDYESMGQFSVSIVELDSESTLLFVQFIREPQRFLPSIFDGLWAYGDKHPAAGELKLLRVITGNDSITRVIGRQGRKVYAYPWIE